MKRLCKIHYIIKLKMYSYSSTFHSTHTRTWVHCRKMYSYLYLYSYILDVVILKYIDLYSAPTLHATTTKDYGYLWKNRSIYQNLIFNTGKVKVCHRSNILSCVMSIMRMLPKSITGKSSCRCQIWLQTLKYPLLNAKNSVFSYFWRSCQGSAKTVCIWLKAIPGKS